MVCIVRLKLELCVTSLGSTLQYFMALASTVLHGPRAQKDKGHVPPCPYGCAMGSLGKTTLSK